MVKCRNKKIYFIDICHKPTRLALSIRSQSLSAVSEIRVLLDGFVIFHGWCMWCPSFRVRPVHACRDVSMVLFASLLVYLTVTKTVLCQSVFLWHSSHQLFDSLTLKQMKNCLGLVWGITLIPELTLFPKKCGRTTYISANHYCNQQTYKCIKLGYLN